MAHIYLVKEGTLHFSDFYLQTILNSMYIPFHFAILHFFPFLYPTEYHWYMLKVTVAKKQNLKKFEFQYYWHFFLQSTMVLMQTGILDKI